MNSYNDAQWVWHAHGRWAFRHVAMRVAIDMYRNRPEMGKQWLRDAWYSRCRVYLKRSNFYGPEQE